MDSAKSDSLKYCLENFFEFIAPILYFLRKIMAMIMFSFFASFKTAGVLFIFRILNFKPCIVSLFLNIIIEYCEAESTVLSLLY